MTAVSARQKELLSLPRWAWLKECIATWYAEPISEKDGLPVETIDQAEARLGVRIPKVLQEWYELVGARLDFIQDQPLLPHQLQVTNGHLEFWWENQGCWTLGAALNQGDNPPVHVFEGEGMMTKIFTLSAWLHGMTLSETVTGIWADRWAETLRTPDIGEYERRSFLGKVKAEVQGGYFGYVSEEVTQWATQHFPELSAPNVPFLECRTFGDQSTFLRVSEGDVSIEWMTATPQAFTEATTGLHLLDGDYILVLMRRNADIRWSPALVGKKKPDDETLYRSVLTPEEWMRVMTLDPEPKPFVAVFTTRQPEALAARLWKASPPEYREHTEFYVSPAQFDSYQRIFPQP